MFDLAPLMILIMILFSVTEKSSIIRLCVITYYLTMCYDFIFVLKHAIELTTLTVTRTLFLTAAFSKNWQRKITLIPIH